MGGFRRLESCALPPSASRLSFWAVNPLPEAAFAHLTRRWTSLSALLLLGLAIACKNGKDPDSPDGQGGDSSTDSDDSTDGKSSGGKSSDRGSGGKSSGDGTGGKSSTGGRTNAGGSGGDVDDGSGGRATGGAASGGAKGSGGAGAGGNSASTGGSSQGTGGSGNGVVLPGTIVWQNDFEFTGPDWQANTWPGDRDSNGDGRPEFLSYLGTGAAELDYHDWNVMHKDQLDAWLDPGQQVDKSVIRGDYVYVAQIKKPFTSSHRAYPSIHFDQAKDGGGHPDYPQGIPSPMVNQWWVWWDPEGGLTSCWKHLATWSNNTDWTIHGLLAGKSGDVYRLTFNNGKVKVVNEFNQDQNNVPIGKWFRVTAYIDYSKDNGGGDNDGFAAYWLDDALVATVSGKYLSPLPTNHTTYLKRAHWGLYAEGSCDSGRWIEDDNLIWTLDEPMTEFERVPLPPPR